MRRVVIRRLLLFVNNFVTNFFHILLSDSTKVRKSASMAQMILSPLLVRTLSRERSDLWKSPSQGALSPAE